jgi:hypothetical protein
LQKKESIDLASRIPELWAKTSNVKDKKRIVRLLISDITVTKDTASKTLALNLRWQTGQLQQINVPLPQNVFEKIRYPEEIVD